MKTSNAEGDDIPTSYLLLKVKLLEQGLGYIKLRCCLKRSHGNVQTPQVGCSIKMDSNAPFQKTKPT